MDPDPKPSAVTPTEKGRQYVVVEDMSLQDGMNPFSTIILELSRGSRVTLIANRGEWSEVETQGQTGYVYSDSIQKTSGKVIPLPEKKAIAQPATTPSEVKVPSVPEEQPESEVVSVSAPPQREQAGGEIGIVNEETSIMKKPSSFSGIVVDISPGTEVKVLGKERDFLEVRYKDKKGFVYEEFVEIIE